MDELISAIKNGLIDLAPDESSGWYDYQSWALETLLLPERGGESDHLLLTAAYKQKLIDTFKSITVQNRETHMKQLEMGVTVGADLPDVKVYPLFPVEPFPTYYLRTARAYRFVSTYLEAVLGEEFLGASRRMTEDGSTSGTTLSGELRDKAELLYGLHLLSADSVGMAPELPEEELLEFPEQGCRDRALQWVSGWTKDADVLRDPRVIVPVQRDLVARETVYWAVVGVKALKASAEFVKGYEPEIIDMGECGFDEFVPHWYYLTAEAFAEVRLDMDSAPPARDELRAICDKYDNVDDIVQALESL